MNINVTHVVQKSYRPLFAKNSVAMTVVQVDVDGALLTFTHREDDKDGAWACDSYISATGAPVWVHGEGERSTVKQCAQGVLLDAILSAV